MDANQFLGGAHLRRHDVPTPTPVTVKGVTSVEFEDDKKGTEQKLVLHFNEFEKGMVLNKTCLAIAIATFGSPDTDLWIGKPIMLYDDPSIQFAGKIVGGLRLRALSDLEAQGPVAF